LYLCSYNLVGYVTEGAFSLLLSPFESSCWVRLPLADPTCTLPCPVASNGRRPAALAAVGAVGAAVAVSPSAPLCGPSRHWVGALARPSRPSPLDLLRPKAVVGQSVFVGRSSSNNKKMFYVFLLLLEKRNTLENVCVLIFAPKLVK
jgi:hypothetical protein